MSLAMIDVDHFKSFNDNFGHTVGDEVLRLIAKMLRTGRKTDLAGRYGGEEFMIVLRDTDAKNGAKAAERIREAVGEHVMQWGEKEIRFTASAGIASIQEFNHEKLDSLKPAKIREILIERADKRLFQAKRQGRNRVVYDTQFAA